MIDEELLPVANMRFILLENPADQVPLPPPPPASESESAMMWRPADRTVAETERIPLNSESDREAAAAYGIWLGASLLHTVIADARKDRRATPDVPPREDEEPDPRDRKK